MGKYNIGELWWVYFPYEESNIEKHRPAIVIDDETIAVLAMYVTSQNKTNPYCIEISDWQAAGLKKQSWARIDKIISIAEWRMDRKIGNLTHNDLTKFMQLIAEKITGTLHEFSIVAIKNNSDKFLQIYDERWQTWLFPYFRSTEANKENIDKCTSELLGLKIFTTFVAYAKHCKFSESDHVYKIYHHKLYKYELQDMIGDNGSVFKINNKKCRWMSFEELENNADIMKKNEDIIAFVKSKC